MRKTTVEANAAHAACMEDFKQVLKKHSHLSGFEMLAISSQLVGQLLALQDQNARSREAYLLTIEANILEGNALAVEAAFQGIHPTKQ